MKFKIGIGLLLFGIILSNGAIFSVGSIFYLLGCIAGIVGFVLIISTDDEKS